MKDYLAQIITDYRGRAQQHNAVREYLQARILESLQERGAFSRWAFVGGTALRFLFRLPRYSEDLDFSLGEGHTEHAFPDLIAGIQADLTAEGYDLAVTSKPDKVVASAFIRFRGLLHELGISPHHDEVLAVKVEVDTNPPRGAKTATTVVRRHVTLNLFHHDRTSLLAGKLHALLTRRYTKGRDLYDLLWYLADRTWSREPNLVLLRNALAQTGWDGAEVSESSWRQIVSDKLEEVDWRAASQDLAAFLERPREVDLLTRDNLLSLLK